MSLLDVSLAPQVIQPLAPRRIPDATFIPTAAGLRPEEPTAQLDFQSMLSDDLAKILAAGIQQGAGGAPHTITHHAQVHANPPAKATVLAQTDYASSEESDRGDDCPEDIEFS